MWIIPNTFEVDGKLMGQKIDSDRPDSGGRQYAKTKPAALIETFNRMKRRAILAVLTWEQGFFENESCE
jgi:hypothetical protein